MIGLAMIIMLLLGSIIGYNVGCRQTEEWYRKNLNETSRKV